MGFNSDTVSWVTNAINKNEYKRQQAPIGLKITQKAFGNGRQMPLSGRYFL